MISAVNRLRRLNGNEKQSGKSKVENRKWKVEMKKYLLIIIPVIVFSAASAQTDSTKPYRIAIFTPLFLDEAFVDNEYQFEKNVFPKYINPGLEFYEGAQLALDSLAKTRVKLEVFIYDTRSQTQSLNQQLEKTARDSVDLIIANCAANEVKQFADEGLRRNIPVVNANLPNDGAVTNNPFFVVLNPTLLTQCEGIYRYIQKYYSLNQLVMFRKKGQLEDRIKTYFQDIGKSTAGVPLKIKYVDLPDSFSVYQLKSHLDSNYQTLAIAGSLDENFGRRLVQQMAILKKQYPVTVMGMPTWDNIGFSRPEFKGVEIIYSSPFYNAKMDKLSTSITSYFTSKMFARPTDMVFRGYEVTMRYAKLLQQYGKDIASNLGSKQYKVFTDFDIQPVFNRQTVTLDYFENKRLYFLKWHDTIIKTVNW